MRSEKASDEVVAGLVDALSDKDRGVHNIVADSLIQIINDNNNRKYLHFLFEKLRSKTASVAIFYVLSELNDHKSLIFLEILSFVRNNSHSIKECEYVLSSVEQDLTPFVQNLKNEDLFIKMRVFEILKQLDSGNKSNVKNAINKRLGDVIKNLIKSEKKILPDKLMEKLQGEDAIVQKYLHVILTGANKEQFNLGTHDLTKVAKKIIIKMVNESKGEAFVSLILENLKYSDNNVQHYNISILDSLEEKSKETNSSLIVSALVEILSGEDRYMRIMASRILLSFGEKARQALVEVKESCPRAGVLIKKFDRFKSYKKQNLQKKLSSVRKKPVVEYKKLLISVMLEYFEKRVVDVSLRDLDYAQPYSLSTLEQIVKGENTFLSVYAALALSSAGEEGISLLLKLLKHKNWLVRRNAIIALGNVYPQSKSIKRALMNIILNDGSGFFKMQAAQALTKRDY
ncbi:HEAT repeat domain-containing protein [Candidatus Uabimicrobium sp. HlEnr_7]|uniref:HEAT repeat domain-containing protein n=1 Tax=Candidatus Uabimicrobium helgolandensis TaxID=3095367 RepID=UPI0035591F81